VPLHSKMYIWGSNREFTCYPWTMRPEIDLVS